MRIYDYVCESGHRFELLVRSSESPDPACRSCGEPAHRRPPGVGLGGRADAGPSHEDAPKSWMSTNRGDRDTLRYWHQQMTRRESLEEKYPELAGDRRPVLAHEGRFAANPLRAGDPVPSSSAEGSSTVDSSGSAGSTGGGTTGGNTAS